MLGRVQRRLCSAAEPPHPAHEAAAARRLCQPWPSSWWWRTEPSGESCPRRAERCLRSSPSHGLQQSPDGDAAVPPRCAQAALGAHCSRPRPPRVVGGPPLSASAPGLVARRLLKGEGAGALRSSSCWRLLQTQRAGGLRQLQHHGVPPCAPPSCAARSELLRAVRRGSAYATPPYEEEGYAIAFKLTGR